jgi:hypothetical protein
LLGFDDFDDFDDGPAEGAIGSVCNARAGGDALP